MIFTILGSSPTCVFSLFVVKGAAAMRVNNTNARLNKPSRTWDDRLLNQNVCSISISFLWRGTRIRVTSELSRGSRVARNHLEVQLLTRTNSYRNKTSKRLECTEPLKLVTNWALLRP